MTFRHARLLAFAAGNLFVTGASASDAPVPVECPASWFGPPASRLVLQTLFIDDQRAGLTTIVSRKGDVYHETYATSRSADIECTYANGARLVVPIPGRRKTCVSTYRYRARPKNDLYVALREVCTFEPTGDPEKDKVAIFVVEPLTRTSDLYGVRLGMSAEEAAKELNKGGYGDVNRDGATLAIDIDRAHRLTVFIDGSNQVSRLVVDPKGSGDHSFYDEMKRRFGLPWGLYAPSVGWVDTGPTCWQWRAEDGTRLEVQFAAPADNAGWQIRLLSAPAK